MKPLDLLVVIAVPMIWGFGFTLAKDTFTAFPPIFLMSLRFSIAALILIWFVRPLWDRAGRLLLTTFVGGTAAYSLQFTGLSGMYASTAVLIVQLEVVFASLLAALVFKDRLNRWQVGAMVVALIGIGFIAGDPQVRGDPWPFVMVALGGLSWAAGQILVKSLGPVGGLRLIAWFAAFAGPQFLIASLVFEEGQWQAVQAAGWTDWAKVFYLSVIMTVGGYALWYRLVGIYRLNQVVPFLLLVPVTSIAGGILVLGEELTTHVAIGGIIVLASVTFIHLSQARPPALRQAASDSKPLLPPET
jgi:O-acetylserine/cysteine efflux transporter